MGSSLIRVLYPLLAAILTIAGTFSLFGISLQEIGVATSAVLTFLSNSNPFVIVGTALVLYVLILEIKYRNTPISVTGTEYRFLFADADGTKVAARQVKWLRANQRHVTAYHQRLGTEAGTIARNSVRPWSNHCEDKEEGKHLYGNEHNWTLVHYFDKALPFRFPVPGIVAAIPLFRGFLSTKRTLKFRLNDAFPSGQRYIALSTNRYPHWNITITVLFPSEDDMPPDDQWHAYRIRKDGMTEITLEPIENTAGQCGKALNVWSSRGEELFISWERIES